MPKVVVHNQVVDYAVGQEYAQAWFDAEKGKLDPFVLVIEGSLGNEEINGEGHWTGFAVNPENGQPITMNEWMDRLAPKAAAVVAVGTCATYGGIPAMKNNPTGAMGVPDYLGWSWKSKAGLPIVCIPGCPAQPDNMTETLLYLALHLAGLAPGAGARRGAAPEVAVRAHRARELQPRRLRRAGRVRDRVRLRPPLPGQARLQGAGGQVQRAGPRLGQRRRRLPERRRHLHGVHDARASPTSTCRSWTRTSGAARRPTIMQFSYGPIVRYFRKRHIKNKYDKEPEWRRTRQDAHQRLRQELVNREPASSM